MQRLFSMFPPGLPGFALLLMRVSVAIALLLAAHSSRQEVSHFLQGAAILLSVALFVGLLTPIAAVLALGLHILMWSVLGVGNAAIAGVVLLDAVALALLGPGAYSIDSHRFGRRVVLRPSP